MGGDKTETYLISITGLVQGVGFRPFIYRVASEFALKGWVENRNDGVFIKINCNEKILADFISAVKQTAPPASQIDSVRYEICKKEEFAGFSIVESKTTSDRITDISPDIAVCGECLRDMKEQKNRIAYPFVNCTNCGPRFTIIKGLPYDREKTTMRVFKMCSSCLAEYKNVSDRRFHAQPVACNDCGPEYTLVQSNSEIKGIDKILSALSSLLCEGKIVAVKGMGGFFLACDAMKEEAVARLRKLKNREGKPFAVMFSSLEKLKEYANVSETEKRSLTSLKRPIVLLEQKKSLAPSVTVGFNTIGAMLPYMPIHYLIFERSGMDVIVLTSGNISDEPIITGNSEAVEKLSAVADAILTYNREIYNRTDDSVVSIFNNEERVFRRSRGYAPSPVNLKINVDGIFASGAELVNCFCIGRGSQAMLSQHIGDLKNMETYEFFCESAKRYNELFLFKPMLVASDMHPDYLSSRYASEMKLPNIKIQHHHAHIASCMAENGLDEKVIGVSFDGTGYGDDGNIWGSEFFVCDLEGYERVSHFAYMPTPGGDKVTHEPWRMALSYLYSYYGKNFRELNPEFLKNIDPASVDLLCSAIDNKINCPLTSGAGRLFDAVSALLNLTPFSKFHAEAPMRLEAVINKKVKEEYPFIEGSSVDFKQMFDGILADMKNGTPVGDISSKFHNTIVSVVRDTVHNISKKYRIKKVALSGGVFQNKYLLENIETKLSADGFEVYSNKKIPTNDGGIALGQIAVAGKKRA